MSENSDNAAEPMMNRNRPSGLSSEMNLMPSSLALT